MSEIPVFNYLSRDAADIGPTPIRFVELLLSTKRFYRTQKSQLLFNTRPPGEDPSFVLIERRDHLRAILEEGDTVRITADNPDEAYQSFWFWLNARKFKLPAAIETRRPAGVAR